MNNGIVCFNRRVFSIQNPVFLVRHRDQRRTASVGGNIYQTNCGGLPGHLPNKVMTRRNRAFQPAAPQKDQFDDHASRSTRPWRRLHQTNRPCQRSTAVSHSPVLTHRFERPSGLPPECWCLHRWSNRMAPERPSSDRSHPTSHCRITDSDRCSVLEARSATPATRYFSPNRPKIPRDCR